MIFGALDKESLKAILDLSPREIAISGAAGRAGASSSASIPRRSCDVTAASVEQLVSNYHAALSAAGKLAALVH